MSELKNKIIASLHFLVQNTSSLPLLLILLLEEGILTEVEHQEIKNPSNIEFEQHTLLYQTLIKKGDGAFVTIIECLQNSGNQVCAEKIKNSRGIVNAAELEWFKIKSSAPLCKGRDEDFDTIKKFLKESLECNSLMFVAITGLAGVGKTELATRFAKFYYDEIKGHCICINSESNQTICNSFQELASQIGISRTDLEGNEKTKETLSFDVYQNLQQRSNKKCLFIFDNLENQEEEESFLTTFVKHINKLSPSYVRPFILITSRCNQNYQDLGLLVEDLQLNSLSREAALEFLKEALKVNGNEDVLENVNEKLNCFPLALQQAVAYIKQQSGYLTDIIATVKSYLDSFESKTKELLKCPLPKALDGETTTFLSWQITLDKIGPTAKYAMEIISFFHSDNMDQDFIRDIMGRDKESETNTVFETLKSYSLCQIHKNENKKSVVSVQHLVQYVIRMRLKEDEKLTDFLDNLMEILNKMLSGANFPWNQLIHVDRLWKYASKSKILLEKHPDYPANIVIQYINAGKYREAYDFSKGAVNVLKSEFGTADSQTLRMKSLNISAHDKLCEDENDLKELKEIYLRQAELFFESSDKYPEDHNLETARLVGKLYWRRGKYNEAICWFTMALEKRQARDGAKINEATLSLKHDTAVILDFQGKYVEALKMFEEVKILRKELLGEEHPDTLTTEQHIGIVKLHQSKYNDALTIFNDVYCKRSLILGPSHPDILSTKQNIGKIYRFQEKYQDALTIYNQVFIIQQNVLGKDHRDILSTLMSIGDVERYQGKLDQALEKYERVLLIKMKELGESHPDTLTTMHSKANTKFEQRKDQEALDIYNRVWDIRKRVLGERHPNTFSTMANIAKIKDVQGEYEEAIRIYKEVLRLAEGVLEHNDPDLLTTKFNIGLVKHRQRNFSEALEIYENVKTSREEILGEEHSYTLATKNYIALVQIAQRKYEEALLMYEEVLEVMKRKYEQEQDHPDLMAAIKNVEDLKYYLGSLRYKIRKLFLKFL